MQQCSSDSDSSTMIQDILHSGSNHARHDDDDSKRWSALVPKEETQAMDFVANHSTYDGRGVICGIFDTGVDPNAIGLNSKTSHGLQKVIDVIDCTGSGDVIMNEPIKISDSSTTLVGLTGRTLRVNSNWINPTGEYRLGVKKAFDLYPRGLKSRVVEERKRKEVIENNRIESDLQYQLSQTTSVTNSDTIDDIKSKISQYKSESSADDGPLYDCIVFHDGERYQACIDTTETGDMTMKECMTDYHHLYQYDTFSDIDALNYCVNVYDNGKILSIVVDAGAHGSHVAGIVSACHPSQPELNGVAPGAQIISFKIGDTRLGSMETSTGIYRAFTKAVKRKCDIINMSYGEAVSIDNYGKLIQIAQEVVEKHNIIFVSSAGNNGPALSTVGSPGGTSSCSISVAAMPTQGLIDMAYATNTGSGDTTHCCNYTWSSCGPTIDGDFGVDIIAPGGAVTSVPQWTQSRNQLMNGTSMSSPNACGCIALLLSAAKQEGIKYTPGRIKKIIQNSAKFVPSIHELGQGHGIIQVDNAYKLMSYMNSTYTDIDPSSPQYDWLDVIYRIKVDSIRFSRGIYLRQPSEVNEARTYAIDITPVFHEDTSVALKTLYEVRVRLECTVPWVSCPQYLYLNTNGKSFNALIDPRALSPGLYTAKIKAYAEHNMNFGTIFEVPVTVVVPEVVADYTTSLSLDVIELATAERYRKFIVPPRGCSYIDMIVEDVRQSGSGNTVTTGSGSGSDGSGETTPPPQASPDSDGSNRLLAIHALQVYKGSPYRDNEFKEYCTLSPGSTQIYSFNVNDTRTLELVIARNWNTLGALTRCKVTLYFRGVTPTPISLIGGSRVSDMIRVHANLGNATVSPAGTLDTWTSVIKPTNPGIVSTLDERDVLPNGEVVYALVLEYDVDIAADVSEITCRFPSINSVLYESEFLGQFHMVYDCNRRLIGSGDAYPSAVKVQKGKHTVRLQVRHTSPSILDDLKDLPLNLQRKLSKSITLSFYSSANKAIIGTEKTPTFKLLVSTCCSLYLKEPKISQLPKTAAPGDCFTGSVTFLKNDTNVVARGSKPNGNAYPVKYVLCETKPKEEKAKVDTDTTTTTIAATATVTAVAAGVTVLTGLNKSMKDAKIAYLKTFIGNKTSFDIVYDSITAHDMSTAAAAADADSILTYLPLRQTLLSHHIKCKVLAATIDTTTTTSATGTATAIANEVIAKALDQIVTSAMSVVSLIDIDAILIESSKLYDQNDKLAVDRHTDITSKKPVLLDAMYAQAISLYELMLYHPSGDDTSRQQSMSNAFELIVKQFLTYDCMKDDKYVRLQVATYKHKKLYGLALKRVNTLLSDGKVKLTSACNGGSDCVYNLYSEKLHLLQLLGWDSLVSKVQKQQVLCQYNQYGAF